MQQADIFRMLLRHALSLVDKGQVDIPLAVVFIVLFFTQRLYCTHWHAFSLAISLIPTFILSLVSHLTHLCHQMHLEAAMVCSRHGGSAQLLAARSRLVQAANASPATLRWKVWLAGARIELAAAAAAAAAAHGTAAGTGNAMPPNPASSSSASVSAASSLCASDSQSASDASSSLASRLAIARRLLAQAAADAPTKARVQIMIEARV